MCFNRTSAQSSCPQAAYAVANQCSAMVSTAEARETPKLHGPVAKFRSDTDRVLQREKYLKVVLSRVGWSRSPSTLTAEDVRKVQLPATCKHGSLTSTTVFIACWAMTTVHCTCLKRLLPKDMVWYNFTNFCTAGHMGLLAKCVSLACQSASTPRFQICKYSLGQ